MTWTVLRVVTEGVVLRDFHAARFASCGDAIRLQFEAFAHDAAPGNYGLRDRDGTLEISRRGPSRLLDGMPVRFAVSPFSGAVGAFAKPPAPSPYDAVRADGVATLLTSADGNELFESCSASLVGWDGRSLVLVPASRPRVASTVEAALRASGAAVEAPLHRHDAMPLVLANAVRGACRVEVPARDPFPDEAFSRIEALLRATTRR